ncbi:hypothetical protein [Shewanella violacea]|uniref:Lipoprotein n=1 Tax=Shewanella violacea (strain JCM 10179 / CIP 106290 / LMG 19151 / DSS12) TaxID=637905 RepID=D4ZK93_SHEVD|nr:hypothetical protein [Shewanella violacea]BAJ02092.1 hypothetical protein SVI_2121 [Shewanella violacea DSS12]
MKFIIILLCLFSSTVFSEDIAIDAVKKHPKIIEFLSDKPRDQYWIDFHQMKLGGSCGFTGCQWRKLVSLVVTSKSANALSETIIALVNGEQPSHNSNIKVRFVELENLDEKQFKTQ